MYQKKKNKTYREHRYENMLYRRWKPYTRGINKVYRVQARMQNFSRGGGAKDQCLINLRAKNLVAPLWNNLCQVSELWAHCPMVGHIYIQNNDVCIFWFDTRWFTVFRRKVKFHVTGRTHYSRSSICNSNKVCETKKRNFRKQKLQKFYKNQ